ncbi:uncharacterized protein LOC108914355 isoform X2 [Anoplophora glabripennis]|nr:uncharacterized protein LOC108914355 isoform X2 [Anoplophora glabripennis]XP_018575681.1 uncharacterized protein LOC108914355 isoform X2 [Anoplophora glabripennis]
MLSRVFVSHEYICNTKCTKCNNYLSVPPIIIRSNNPVCGRCVTQTVDPVENRAYFFEDLAKFMFFPCINDICGCTFQSPWGKVLDHEIRCEYQRIICPAIECANKIRSDEITCHFENKHQHLILKQNQCLLPQFNTENSCENKLFMWKDQLFIIQIMASDNEDIYFRISSFKGPVSKALKLILSSKSSSSTISLDKFVTVKYASKFPPFYETEKINTGALKHVLGSKITCVFKFDDELKSKNSEMGNNKLLSEIECLVCADYMRPPIYMCPTGHSLCGKCKAKLSKCPLCSRQFGDTRNYSLERIAEIITYPCRYKYQGCNFAGNLENITQHELVCSISFVDEIACIATISCKWKGQYSEVFQHIISHHKYSFYLGCPMSINASASTNTLGFFEYDNKVFKLYIEWNENKKNEMRWSVTYVKSKDECSDKYMFHLDFVSGIRTFTISDICPRKPAAAVKKNCVQFVNIPFFQIKPFIKENKVTFTLNMVKVC